MEQQQLRKIHLTAVLNWQAGFGDFGLMLSISRRTLLEISAVGYQFSLLDYLP
jgi:hypothetical protein